MQKFTCYSSSSGNWFKLIRLKVLRGSLSTNLQRCRTGPLRPIRRKCLEAEPGPETWKVPCSRNGTKKFTHCWYPTKSWELALR